MKRLKATWHLSNDGYDAKNREILIELAFRLAGLVEPGFGASRSRSRVAETSGEGEYGGSWSVKTYRVGEADGGVEVTDSVSSPNDGLSPFQSSTRILAYGLPAECRLELSGTFTAPLYGKPNAAWLSARAPADRLEAIRKLLAEEFDAAFLDHAEMLPGELRPPAGSKMGGLTGVFASGIAERISLSPAAPLPEGYSSREANAMPPPPRTSIYHLLRFYEYGLVLSGSVALAEGHPREQWPDLSIWFNRNSPTQQVPRGMYYVAGDRVWFSIAVESPISHKKVTTEYNAVLAGDRLLLDAHNHATDMRRIGEELVKIEAEDS